MYCKKCGGILMNIFTRKDKFLLMLAVICLNVCIFGGTKAYAATHAVDSGHIDPTMITGEVAEMDQVFFHSVEDR